MSIKRSGIFQYGHGKVMEFCRQNFVATLVQSNLDIKTTFGRGQKWSLWQVLACISSEWLGLNIAPEIRFFKLSQIFCILKKKVFMARWSLYQGGQILRPLLSAVVFIANRPLVFISRWHLVELYK